MAITAWWNTVNVNETSVHILGECGCDWHTTATYAPVEGGARPMRHLAQPRCAKHGATFRTMRLSVPSDCSICRRRHGREIEHACE